MTDKYFERIHLQGLAETLLSDQEASVLITGPSGVGKSTSVREILNSSRVAYEYAASPLRLEKLFQKAMNLTKGKKTFLLVLDNVEPLGVWEKKLLAAMKALKKCGVKMSLIVISSEEPAKGTFPGFAHYHLPRWSFDECKHAFGATFDEFVFYGNDPAAWQVLVKSKRNEARWARHVLQARSRRKSRQSPRVEKALGKGEKLFGNALANARAMRRFKATRENPALWKKLLRNAVGSALLENNPDHKVMISRAAKRHPEIVFILKSGKNQAGLQLGPGSRRAEKTEPKPSRLRTIVAHASEGDLGLEQLVNMTADEILGHTRFLKINKLERVTKHPFVAW